MGEDLRMDKKIRVSKVLKEFNIGLGTLVEFLNSKKIEIESSPGTQISSVEYDLIAKEFGKEVILKERSKEITIRVEDTAQTAKEVQPQEEPSIKGSTTSASLPTATEIRERERAQKEAKEEEERERAQKEAEEQKRAEEQKKQKE
ncbi:MAG: hypothetical protein WC960_05370, partial [Bacteroidales bacterium]